jgi:hypothetical protein
MMMMMATPGVICNSLMNRVVTIAAYVDEDDNNFDSYFLAR